MLAIVAAGGGALHSWHTRGLYVEAALLSEAYNLTSPVKLRVSDHYIKFGVMPNDNADADLPPPKSVFGTSVKRVAVNRGGVIVVDFEEEIGARSMTFSPAVSPVSGLLSWRCTSDSIDSTVLEKLMPACEYLPSSLESQLMNAIANGNTERVNMLLGAGAQVDAVVYGNTPLMLASKTGNLDIVKQLLDGGAQVDNTAVNAERRTPLMVAITSDQRTVASLLLSKGASVSRRDYRGLTAMDHAIATDRRLGGRQYVLLVAAKYNPRFAGAPDVPVPDQPTVQEKDDFYQALYTELRSTAKVCRVKRLATLLEAENDLHAPELINGQPLHSYARKRGCSEALLAFIKHKETYQRALHARFANEIRQCHAKQSERILADNPELSVLSQHRNLSHLNRAISTGCATVLRLMIRHQDLTDKLDHDVLVRAISNAPQATLVQLVGNLIAVGADVNGLDEQGRSPLGVAIALEQPVVAKYLVDAGADVNYRTVSDSFPIIEASKKGYEHLVMQMIANGAKLDSRDALGRTALLAAVGRDRQRLVDSLVRAGANARARDANGMDAVLLAESRNLRQIKQILIASID